MRGRLAPLLRSTLRELDPGTPQVFDEPTRPTRWRCWSWHPWDAVGLVVGGLQPNGPDKAGRSRGQDDLALPNSAAPSGGDVATDTRERQLGLARDSSAGRSLTGQHQPEVGQSLLRASCPRRDRGSSGRNDPALSTSASNLRPTVSRWRLGRAACPTSTGCIRPDYPSPTSTTKI
jgi:hypothetical protein